MFRNLSKVGFFSLGSKYLTLRRLQNTKIFTESHYFHPLNMHIIKFHIVLSYPSVNGSDSPEYLTAFQRTLGSFAY